MKQAVEKKAIKPALRFPEFKAPLTKKKLSEVAELTSSKRIHLSDYVKSGVPFFRGKEISLLKNNRLPEDMLYISPEQYKDIKEKYGIPEVGDILITAVGTLGNVFCVEDDRRFYFKDGNLIWFRNVLEHSKYLGILLNAKQKDVLLSAIGSSQKALTMVELNKLKFEFPDKKEQQKIASFLTAVDDKLQLLRRKRDGLQAYKRGVMQQLFSQTLRFKQDDGSDFPDWEEKKANELFKNHSNKNHNSDLPILAVTQENGVVNREDVGIDIKTSVQSIESYKVIEKGDFVISLRSFQGGIEYSNVLGISSPAYTILKPKLDINDDFYRVYFKKEDFISKLSSTVIGIRDGKQISYDSFSILKLPYPSLGEQEKISNFITSIENKISSVSQQITQTETFKQGLLQKMFV